MNEEHRMRRHYAKMDQNMDEILCDMKEDTNLDVHDLLAFFFQMAEKLLAIGLSCAPLDGRDVLAETLVKRAKETATGMAGSTGFIQQMIETHKANEDNPQ